MQANYDIVLSYSEHRPTHLAWRAECRGHMTYAATREGALALHDAKMKTDDSIAEMLQLCAACTTK